MSLSKVTLVLSFTLAVGFTFFGVQKFGAENIIFETIASRSGIGFFEPYLRLFIGFIELATVLLLLIPRTRKIGGLTGTVILLGAIGFHLSPWLGINVPTVGHFLFITAVIMLIMSFINLVLLHKAQSS